MSQRSMWMSTGTYIILTIAYAALPARSWRTFLVIFKLSKVTMRAELPRDSGTTRLLEIAFRVSHEWVYDAAMPMAFKALMT